MIKSYKYLSTAKQLKLQQLIMSFFDNVESQTGHFNDAFFGADLLEIVNHHPRILKAPLKAIYEDVKRLGPSERTLFFDEIKNSNEIESICQGIKTPKRLSRHVKNLHKKLRDMFLNLYKQVLDGDAFNNKYGTTLREHFDDFSKLNADITLCPICGIGELKKHLDVTRDQYDHYLPQSFYPFSAVNFENLVPGCKECNSLDVKGDKDIVALATNHKLFFPYDSLHKGIDIAVSIVTDHIDIDQITWNIVYTNPDNKTDEITSWRTIYDIDVRYRGFIGARVDKWYSHYWSFQSHGKTSSLSDSEKANVYDAFLELDEEYYINFLRRPALNAFIAGSTLAQAAIEAKLYSNVTP